MAQSSAASRVTIVANDIGPVGGMEAQLTVLISGLLERGFQVTVVSWTCDMAPHPALRWVRVPGFHRPAVVAYPLFALLASALVRMRGEGLVHSTGAILLARCDVSTVHFCHLAAARHFAFSRASRSNLAYRLNAAVASWMSRIGERWCYRPSRAGRLVAVSHGLAGELARHFPNMAGKVVVIPNGVDTATFHPPDPAPDARERLRAIFVGSEWERKGLRLSIEALGHAPMAELVVVGEGDAPVYRQLAESLGVSERVEFVGRSTEVADLYRGADLFLLPTSYEAAPLVTYEAAASGLPLLVTKVNGTEELVRDGISGWFIPADPLEIGRRLQLLAGDPDLRRSMGAAARKDSLKYTWLRAIESYHELYRALASPSAE